MIRSAKYSPLDLVQTVLNWLWVSTPLISIYHPPLYQSTNITLGLSDGNVHISYLAGGDSPNKMSFDTESEMPITHIRWMNNNNLYASNADGYLVHYSLASSKYLFVVQHV